jgi:hypothetical protein
VSKQHVTRRRTTSFAPRFGTAAKQRLKSGRKTTRPAGLSVTIDPGISEHWSLNWFRNRRLGFRTFGR